MALLFLPLTEAAAAISGSLNRSGFRSSICNIEKMDVSFKIDESFGEPLITSSMRWQAGPNTSADCLSRNTNIWVAMRTPSDELRYAKFTPSIQPAGADFGATITESPSWSVLFCTAPSDNAVCATQEEAHQLFASNLRPESFEVVTKALAISNFGNSADDRNERNPAPTGDSKIDLALDDLLADAIDNAIAPGQASADSQPAEAAPLPVIEEPTAEELEARRLRQKAEQQKVAANNIVTLLASSLAQYKTPPHDCESPRIVSQWVQARGECVFGLRQEISHEYLCAEDGKPRTIHSASSADLDLRKDVSRISDIRVSEEGWASLVLELNGDINRQTDGSFKTDRWQFTASQEQLEDLQQLAGSIVVLKQFCESES
ncbi:MAG: hypothetical protein KDI36_08250 [Pseudomonadales bacterium]|nr:hypothetical protein [Pseudomonadales bacterium]